MYVVVYFALDSRAVLVGVVWMMFFLSSKFFRFVSTVLIDCVSSFFVFVTFLFQSSNVHTPRQGCGQES